MRTGWMADAACAGSELDFYDYDGEEHGQNTDWVKFAPMVTLCARCPVLEPCATWAMNPQSPETEGVWAGTTPVQRRDARRATDPVAAVVSRAQQNYDARYEELRKAATQQTQLPMTGTGRP